jgi:hypothetical protein
MRKRSSSVASYASGDGTIEGGVGGSSTTVWMGEGGVISPTVMGGVLPGEGLAGGGLIAVPPKATTGTTAPGNLNLDKPLPIPQELLNIPESDQEEEDIDASPLAPCLKPIAVDEVDKKIRERCSLDGHTPIPNEECRSLLKGGISARVGCGAESDDDEEPTAGQHQREESSDSASSSDSEKEKVPVVVKVLASKPLTSPTTGTTPTSGTATPSSSNTLTPTRPSARPSSYHSASPSDSGTSTPTPLTPHQQKDKAQYVLAPPLKPSTSGSSTPTKSILKNASQGGGRILTDAEVEAREERRRKRREERMRREVEERLLAEAAARDNDGLDHHEGHHDDENEGRRTRARITPLKTQMVHDDYVLVSTAGQSSESSDEGPTNRPTISRSSSRSSRSSTRSSTSRKGIVKREWDMSLAGGDNEGGIVRKKMGNKRHSFPLNLPFAAGLGSHSAPSSPARSTFPSSISSSSSKQAAVFAHSVSPPSPSSPSYSGYNPRKSATRKTSSTSLQQPMRMGKKYDLSGHVKQPLYCPGINRRAASDGDVPQEEAETGCQKTGKAEGERVGGGCGGYGEEDEMLFPLPKNRTPSPVNGSTGSLADVKEGCEGRRQDGVVEQEKKNQEKREDERRQDERAQKEAAKKESEVKKEVKKPVDDLDEEFALPSRRHRPTPPSSSVSASIVAPHKSSSSSIPASSSNTSNHHALPPQHPVASSSSPQPIQTSSPSPPTNQKPPRNLAFRGPTSILPSIPGSRPTSSHSRTFSDSQLPRSSTSSLRRPYVEEPRVDVESLAKALVDAVASSGQAQGETKAVPKVSSGSSSRTMTQTPRERSVSASESVGHHHQHPTSGYSSVPSTPNLSSSANGPPTSYSSNGAHGAAPANGGRQVQKRKPSFSLRMKHLKEVGADVWRGVGSIGSGVGRLA